MSLWIICRLWNTVALLCARLRYTESGQEKEKEETHRWISQILFNSCTGHRFRGDVLCLQQGLKHSYMDISDYENPKDSAEVEICETLDVPEDNITSEELDNRSTHQLDYAQDYGESKDKDQDMEETLPTESQGDT